MKVISVVPQPSRGSLANNRNSERTNALTPSLAHQVLSVHHHVRYNLVLITSRKSFQPSEMPLESS